MASTCRNTWNLGRYCKNRVDFSTYVTKAIMKMVSVRVRHTCAYIPNPFDSTTLLTAPVDRPLRKNMETWLLSNTSTLLVVVAVDDIVFVARLVRFPRRRRWLVLSRHALAAAYKI